MERMVLDLWVDQHSLTLIGSHDEALRNRDAGRLHPTENWISSLSCAKILNSLIGCVSKPCDSTQKKMEAGRGAV